LKANTESLLSRTGIGFEQKVLEANKQRGVLATEQQFFLDRYIKHLPKIHSSSKQIFAFLYFYFLHICTYEVCSAFNDFMLRLVTISRNSKTLACFNRCLDFND